MMNDLISIIVPIYNAEKYLQRCIGSIISQTYSNIEIILIDDGSIDNSPKICDDYSKKDLRIKVIHKSNDGVSVARNIGIELAQGKYITFIDSDDYIEKNHIEVLYKLCIECDSDISICGVIDKFLNGKIVKTSKYKKCVNGKDAINLMLCKKKYFGWTCWAKMYKLDKIKHNKFMPNVNIAEDVEFLYRALKNSQKVNIDTSFLTYNYVRRKQSAIHSGFNDDRKKEFEIYKSIKSDMEKFMLESQKNIEAWYFKRVVFIMSLIKETSQYKEELNILKKEINFRWLTNKNIKLKDKIKYIIK